MGDNNEVEVSTFNLMGKKIRLYKQKEETADFGNKTYTQVNVLGQKIDINDTLVSTWVIMGVLIIFALIVRISLKKFKQVPKGFQNFVETIVGGFNNFVSSTMGEANKSFAAFYAGMFIFILISNISGLFALRPPTADIATTFALALITFFMIQGFAIKSKGFRNYVKSFFEPMPFLFPINLIGELATPISLSFRLFGNMLGGTIIMGLVYSIPTIFVKIGIPAALHVYFDLFAGVLQAMIFVILSMTFVSNSLNNDEEKEVKSI